MGPIYLRALDPCSLLLDDVLGPLFYQERGGGGGGGGDPMAFRMYQNPIPVNSIIHSNTNSPRRLFVRRAIQHSYQVSIEETPPFGERNKFSNSHFGCCETFNDFRRTFNGEETSPLLIVRFDCVIPRSWRNFRKTFCLLSVSILLMFKTWKHHWLYDINGILSHNVQVKILNMSKHYLS